MAAVRVTAETKVSSSQCYSANTNPSFFPIATCCWKELGKKLQLPFIYWLYYTIFLDRELTLFFCCLYYYCSFTFSCSSLLFVLLFSFRFVGCCVFFPHSFPSLPLSFPPFLVFLVFPVLFDVCFGRLNKSLVRIK